MTKTRPVRHRRLVGLLLPVFVLLLLTACGGGGGSQSPAEGGPPPATETKEAQPQSAEASPEDAPGIDACTLLTPADYAAVMAASPEKIEQHTTGIFHFCSFQQGGNVSGVLVGAARTSEDYFDSSLKNETQLVGQQAEPVEVTGGKAYWLTESLLVVGYKNGIFFRVSASTPIETKAKAVALAKRVAGHIP